MEQHNTSGVAVLASTTIMLPLVVPNSNISSFLRQTKVAHRKLPDLDNSCLRSTS